MSHKDRLPNQQRITSTRLLRGGARPRVAPTPPARPPAPRRWRRVAVVLRVRARLPGSGALGRGGEPERVRRRGGRGRPGADGAGAADPGAAPCVMRSSFAFGGERGRFFVSRARAASRVLLFCFLPVRFLALVSATGDERAAVALAVCRGRSAARRELTATALTHGVRRRTPRRRCCGSATSRACARCCTRSRCCSTCGA